VRSRKPAPGQPAPGALALYQPTTQRHRWTHDPPLGHTVSQRIRKRIEEPFGWIKTVGGGRKLRYKGRRRNRAWFLIAGAVYNLIRITALDAQAA